MTALTAAIRAVETDNECHQRCFHCGAYADECQCDGGTGDDLRFRLYARMLTNPFHVKLAIYPENPNPIWAGETWWRPDDGGEDLDQLRADAEARMACADLSTNERVNLEAALWALDDFEQGRKNAADDRLSYRPPFCG